MFSRINQEEAVTHWNLGTKVITDTSGFQTKIMSCIGHAYYAILCELKLLHFFIIQWSILYTLEIYESVQYLYLVPSDSVCWSVTLWYAYCWQFCSSSCGLSWYRIIFLLLLPYVCECHQLSSFHTYTSRWSTFACQSRSNSNQPMGENLKECWLNRYKNTMAFQCQCPAYRSFHFTFIFIRCRGEWISIWLSIHPQISGKLNCLWDGEHNVGRKNGLIWFSVLAIFCYC